MVGLVVAPNGNRFVLEVSGRPRQSARRMTQATLATSVSPIGRPGALRLMRATLLSPKSAGGKVTQRARTIAASRAKASADRPSAILLAEARAIANANLHSRAPTHSPITSRLPFAKALLLRGEDASTDRGRA